MHRLPGSTTLELRGSIPLGAAPSTLAVSVDNPTLFFVSALRDALIANGIDVRGPAVDIDDIADRRRGRRSAPLVTYQSPPLSTLAVRLMKVSQNLYAETFLKTLGTAAGSPTAAAGRTAAQTILQSMGRAAGRADPCATVRGSRATTSSRPRRWSRSSTHVDRDERLRGPFEASLPIAGRDGTLANRMKGTPAEGNARAKTGSMTGVRALSGYVTTADGEPLVFVDHREQLRHAPADGSRSRRRDRRAARDVPAMSHRVTEAQRARTRTVVAGHWRRVRSSGRRASVARRTETRSANEKLAMHTRFSFSRIAFRR